MQSLGKVPSARRPPANLPSLKAETSSPANSTTQSSDQQQQQTNNSSSASWADSSAPAGAQALSNTASGANQTSQLNTSSGSAGQTHTGNSASSSANTSWSAVATGGNVKEENSSQPPLYQSPQFQNEFPSLDGSVTTSAGASATGLKQNSNSNSHDSGEMNLRPSTDAASWMQQQQSNSGSARGGVGENGPGNYPPPDVVPPKFMALMPSFMLRGAQSAGMSSSSAPSHTQYQSNQSREGRDNRDSGGYQNQARQGRNSSQYGGSYGNDYSNSRDNGPPRHRQPPPRHAGRHNDDRSSSYEPEIIAQRPIIKEEELERIDSLACDEGWSKHDEIDYNKKIQFSDDEPDDVKPKDNDRKDGECLLSRCVSLAVS
jgi:BAT2 N-terminus